MTLSPPNARIAAASFSDAPNQEICLPMPQGPARSLFANALIAPVAPEKPADHRKWGQLSGCSDALAICESARNHKGLTLVDRKSTRLNSSHVRISYAVFCLKKKKKK